MTILAFKVVKIFDYGLLTKEQRSEELAKLSQVPLAEDTDVSVSLGSIDEASLYKIIELLNDPKAHFTHLSLPIKSLSDRDVKLLIDALGKHPNLKMETNTPPSLSWNAKNSRTVLDRIKLVPSNEKKLLERRAKSLEPNTLEHDQYLLKDGDLFLPNWLYYGEEALSCPSTSQTTLFDPTKISEGNHWQPLTSAQDNIYKRKKIVVDSLFFRAHPSFEESVKLINEMAAQGFDVYVKRKSGIERLAYMVSEDKTSLAPFDPNTDYEILAEKYNQPRDQVLPLHFLKQGELLRAIGTGDDKPLLKYNLRRLGSSKKEGLLSQGLLDLKKVEDLIDLLKNSNPKVIPPKNKSNSK